MPPLTLAGKLGPPLPHDRLELEECAVPVSGVLLHLEDGWCTKREKLSYEAVWCSCTVYALKCQVKYYGERQTRGFKSNGPEYRT